MLAALLLLGWDLSGLDLVVTRWFGGPQGFPWRDAWLTSTLLHEGGRMLAWALLAFLLVDAARPIVAGPSKAERWFGVGATLASLLLVPSIKRVSRTSCPWDLQEFGGAAAHVSHWTWNSGDGGPGHCFPSGHATAAFAFLSLYFVMRSHRPRLAGHILLAVCTLGLLFGVAQLARGAHPPSHTLWSAWLCWSLGMLITARRPAATPARDRMV